VKVFSVDKIRNAGLIGHGGVGKTSLAEAMLFNMGETNRIGKVDDGSTVSDYHPDEIERKISISTSLLHGIWKDWKINLLDTPGYSDFIGDAKCALRVTDLAVTVLSAVDGVEVGTEQVLEFAQEFNIPRMFFVNRMDNEHADFDKIVNSTRERYGTGVVACQFPVNQGEGFNKIVDVLNLKLITYESDGSGKFTSGDLPDDLKSSAGEMREKIMESAAESDDALLESYFEAGTLTEDQFRTGLRKGLMTRTLIPVFCGSAEKNIGMAQLLDFISQVGPSPGDFEKISVKEPKTDNQVERKIGDEEPLSAMIFKTISEAHVGELSLVRVYSGVLKTGTEVLNANVGSSEKIGQIYLLNGKSRKEIGELRSGDIGALVKLKNTSTGNTLSDKKSPIIITPIKFPEPLISVAVRPKSRGDEEKISNGLHILHDEDPSFTIDIDPELHQTILSGQGELHLKVIIRRLKEKFGVDVDEEKPKVPYRETITAKAEEKYRHKKQTGGAGQFAEVWMRIEPMPRGGGFEFDNKVVGGAISSVFIPSVEKGVKQVLVNGPLGGYRVVDVKAIVYDGKEHPVDSKDIAFQIAGREVFKQAMLKARPILLEPIYDIEVKVPEDHMGDVMGDLSSRRGKIMGMDSKGHFQIIKAKVPLAELDRYATTLRSLTSGRGLFTRSFSHYEPLPKELESKVVDEARASGEKEEEK